MIKPADYFINNTTKGTTFHVLLFYIAPKSSLTELRNLYALRGQITHPCYNVLGLCICRASLIHLSPSSHCFWIFGVCTIATLSTRAKDRRERRQAEKVRSTSDFQTIQGRLWLFSYTTFLLGQNMPNSKVSGDMLGREFSKMHFFSLSMVVKINHQGRGLKNEAGKELIEWKSRWILNLRRGRHWRSAARS